MSMKTRLLLAAVAAAVVLGAPQVRAGDPVAGEARYAETCRNCHGPTAKGMSSYPALTGMEPEYVIDRLERSLGRISMTVRKTLRPLCAAMTSVAALAAAMPALAQAPTVSHEVVLADLSNPWDMAFLPDGTMFFTEKCDGLSVLMPSGEVTKLLGMTGSEGYASTADDLFCEGQAGMQGVAIDPDFADRTAHLRLLDLQHDRPGTNRVLRLTVSEDFSGVADRTDIVEDIPYKPEATDHPFGGPGAHNGGRVRFNPGDGFLYVTTGDTHNGEVPQSPTLIGGKVLRIDRDGNPAEGNSPPEGFDPRIYTYGHRNVQGIAFRPSDNTPVIAEHGPWHSDEVTVLVNGGNGGWDPRPTWPAAATARTTTAATRRTRWRAWIRRNARSSCR
jgi:aldose sugar dehydrogenase